MTSHPTLSDHGLFVVIVVVLLLLTGCSNRPSLLPNNDHSLRKTSTQFAADAALRHPYKAEAPQGGEAVARAHVGYSLDRVEVVNLSDEDWHEVELWVNEKYVVYLPKMERNQLKSINFQMLFDSKGNSFPLDNRQTMVEKLDAYRGGKLYAIPVRLAD